MGFSQYVSFFLRMRTPFRGRVALGVPVVLERANTNRMAVGLAILVATEHLPLHRAGWLVDTLVLMSSRDLPIRCSSPFVSCGWFIYVSVLSGLGREC